MMYIILNKTRYNFGIDWRKHSNFLMLMSVLKQKCQRCMKATEEKTQWALSDMWPHHSLPFTDGTILILV